MIERLVAYASKDLGIAPPLVKFFKSAGFTFAGMTHDDEPGVIWVAGDLPWYQQGKVALHETAHAAHIPEGLPKEVRETDARRFAARGLHWIQQAAWTGR